MKNKKHGIKPPCADYSVARAQGLTVIPDGAVWGGRDEQPVEMRKGVTLKKEKGVDDGEADVSDAEAVDDDEGTQVGDSETVTLLRDIKELLEQLLSLKRKELGEAEQDASEAEIDELVSSEEQAEKEPPLSQPKRKRKCAMIGIGYNLMRYRRCSGRP